MLITCANSFILCIKKKLYLVIDPLMGKCFVAMGCCGGDGIRGWGFWWWLGKRSLGEGFLSFWSKKKKKKGLGEIGEGFVVTKQAFGFLFSENSVFSCLANIIILILILEN